MKIVYLYGTIFTLIITIIILLILILQSYIARIKDRYFFDLAGKLDNFSDINKISYIIADEIKKILKTEFVAVVEYTYSNIGILSSIPAKYSYKDQLDAHELYLILKNLQNEFSIIQNTDIMNKNLKKYFPIFNYEKFFIIPMYNDNKRIITLEIYGKTKIPIILTRKRINQITEIFQKTYTQQVKFNKEVLKTKKNEIIIKFLDRIRNTLDENEIEKQVLKEIVEAFKVDRAYILSTQKGSQNKPKLGMEYLGNPYIKSLKDNACNTDELWQQIKSINTTSPVFVIENSDKFINQNNLKGTPLDIYIKKSQIKSSYPFLIYEDTQNAIYLFVQYTNKAVILDKNDFEIMDLLTKQTSIALTQAKLYSKLIKNSQKEKLLLDLISILRSSLDLKKVASEFTKKVGEFFEADRCIIRFFDAGAKEFSGYNEAFEYKKYFYTSSTKDLNIEGKIEEFLLESEKFHDTLSIQNSPESFDNDFEYKEIVLKYFNENKIQSYLGAFVRYNGKILGLLALHFMQNRHFTKNDEKFIKALADQIGTAIYQSELYLKIQHVAKKEKLLKEILSDTIGLPNKKQIYKYFSEKLIQLLNASGIIIIDFPENKNDSIKYFEHYKQENKNLSLFKNQQIIKDMINKKIISYQCSLEKYSDKKEWEDFLKNTSTRCIATLPLGEKSLILAFFDEKKEFSKFDKNILLSILDVIDKTVNDSLKTAEINNLRETFLSTIAHDLQVPMIAERNAINYLIAKLSNKDENLKEILNSLKETNNQVEDMLKVLMSIYKYESKKQMINKEECDLNRIIENVLNNNKKILKDKKIKIKQETETQESGFYGDLTEITKVIGILLTSAIQETIDGGEITISVNRHEKYLRCCISSDGTNYSENLKLIIFERDLMANNLEHRVGEGMHLYLAKLIINEHNGKIYINNKQDGGIIFCIELE